MTTNNALEALGRVKNLADKIVDSEAMYFGCVEHQEIKEEIETIRAALLDETPVVEG